MIAAKKADLEVIAIESMNVTPEVNIETLKVKRPTTGGGWRTYTGLLLVAFTVQCLLSENSV